MASIPSIIRRQNIALILIGIAFSSLAYCLLLRSQFRETQPKLPGPQSGLVYPMASHGSNYFLSPVQATELGILKYVFAVSFLAGVLLTTQATQTVRLVISAFFFSTEGVSPYGSAELKQSSRRDPMQAWGSPALFFAAIILSFAAFWLSIPYVAAALVLRNVILRP